MMCHSRSGCKADMCSTEACIETKADNRVRCALVYRRQWPRGTLPQQVDRPHAVVLCQVIHVATKVVLSDAKSVHKQYTWPCVPLGHIVNACITPLPHDPLAVWPTQCVAVLQPRRRGVLAVIE